MNAIAAARKRIAEGVRAGTGIGCQDKPGEILCPQWVLLGHTGQRITMDPDYLVEFDLILFLSNTQPDWSDQLDDALVGERNIYAALDEIGVEAGTWDDYGLTTWAGVEYWSVRVPVSVRV